MLAPFDRPTGENPFVVQHDLQKMMQDLVGIVRREDEMQQALVKLEAIKARAAGVGVAGQLSLGHAAFAAIGAYVYVWATSESTPTLSGAGLPPLVGLVLAVGAAALVGFE